MTDKNRTFAFAIVTAGLLMLTACGSQPTQPPQPTYQGGSTQSSYPANNSSASYAQYGVVRSIDLVQQERSSGIGVGAIVGAVVGGVLGNQVGKGDGRKAATVVGAAGGAYAGNEIQKRNQQTQQSDAVRLNIRLQDGSSVSVIQDTAVDIRVGDRVMVQNGTVQRY